MYDVIIIGAGVVGSVAGYYLSQYDMKICMLEAFNDVSNGTSKANSAIIHAGYDPEVGSLMAKYNVEGCKLTKELCEKLDVPYKQNGSFVLAFSDEDLKTIKELYERGIANGVEEMELLDRDQVVAIEPEIGDTVKGALYAKTAGIISPWEFTLALAETAVKNGMELHLNNEVKAIKKENGIFTVTTNQGEYQAKYVINAAGIYADKVHEMIGEKEFTIKMTRGQYYLLDKSQGARVHTTLFQCPNEKGKGVTVTPTVHGNLIVGPDAEAINGEDLATSSDGLAFIKKQSGLSLNNIDFRENVRNFAGIRAKTDKADFIIGESKSVENFFNLAGMASPGLSSAAAVGIEAVKMILAKQSYAKKDNYVDTRKRIRFKNLTDQQKNELIASNPSYGRVICRCETITEGEILETFNTPIPPCSIDGVKRRVNAGMGRCQGGFCGERVALILKDKLNIDYTDIIQDKEGSNILMFKAKEGK